MFPLKDENPTRRRPILTTLLIILNFGIFLWSYFSGSFEEIVNEYGMKPFLVSQGKELYTLFTSMFLHGGFLHIGGNMLYLWIFGDNIEDAFGRKKFLIFYFLCGLAASFSHLLSNPSSTIPAIGASGAISGVLGAYLVLYPRAKVLTAVMYFYFIRVIKIPAFFFLGFWFILQALSASLFLVAGAPSEVAYWAHIGGFLAGAVMALPKRGSRRG
ncbi:MAG: rhomboid family intramembrane serine protease [Hadesarchaea archaeon]|nr:MAG: rhomboid family intramembrane serine protease [Hadesarchaea archaeon]TDA34392.1 MAG: rhomboid family intramembrane serine protease [Hadesarchaea archaeon]